MATPDPTWQLGRDPALLGAVVLAAVQVAITLAPVTATQATLINTFAAAAVGFVVAVLVRSDRWVPGLLGLVKAAGALVVGFGLAWSAHQQAAVMLLLGTVTAVITRTQVTAPVPAAIAGQPE
jgi:CHASE2 domain-containing sensor protein